MRKLAAESHAGIAPRSIQVNHEWAGFRDMRYFGSEFPHTGLYCSGLRWSQSTPGAKNKRGNDFRTSLTLRVSVSRNREQYSSHPGGIGRTAAPSRRPPVIVSRGHLELEPRPFRPATRFPLPRLCRSAFGRELAETPGRARGRAIARLASDALDRLASVGLDEPFEQVELVARDLAPQFASRAGESDRHIAVSIYKYGFMSRAGRDFLRRAALFRYRAVPARSCRK